MEFHPACSRKIFGSAEAPVIPYAEDEMLNLGEQVIKSQTTVTGVQPKLSLELEKLSKKSEPQRFTIVSLWGNYILKPPTKEYRNLPELEDLTMHLASLAGIQTVHHSLIRLVSGSLSYITKRIDRIEDQRIHMEDMCQLTERLTELDVLLSLKEGDSIDFYEATGSTSSRVPAGSCCRPLMRFA